MAKKVPPCGSCRKGAGSPAPAEWRVTAYIWCQDPRREVLNKATGKYEPRKVFLRANLCSDHVYCITQDGGEILTKERIT